MRALLAVAVLLCAGGSAWAQGARQIKILTIGSSFAANATYYLPRLAEAAGVKVVVGKANLSGAGLARHARHLLASMKDRNDPAGRPYEDRDQPGRPKYSLIEALRSENWDYVTIQQFSGDSGKPETYEPHAGQLIEAIRKHAPKARILVHQTWAYREDHDWYLSGATTQRKMFEGLKAAYGQLARRYGLGLIPVGEAFQAARAAPMWKFKFPDPEFNYRNPPQGALPDQSGSLTVGWHWVKNTKTGAMELRKDAKHANTAGAYLGACVFFEVLTGRDVTGVQWRPGGLSEEQASSLRRIAHQAAAARDSREPDADEDGFKPMFDGRTLTNWDGDPAYWRVEDGAIVGEVRPDRLLRRNSFLIWRGGAPKDFELKAEYRITREGNSGINYRSVQLTDAPWSLAGYQADIDGPEHEKREPRRRYTGQIYEERGRRFLALRGQHVRVDAQGRPKVVASLGEPEALEAVVNDTGWNSYHLIVRGNVLTQILNGQVMSVVVDDDEKGRRMGGLIGVQVHTGPPHKVEFRNLRLKQW